jgi:hypothetical protein
VTAVQVDIGALPEWLLVGLAVGAVASLVAAVLFVLAERLFPSPGGASTSTDPTSDETAGRSDDGRRRTEIREYLRTIDEPFAEDRAVAGESVAFYLTDRDVAITFDPRTYYRVDGEVAHVVLAEHEMPGAGLGARLPFETPSVGGTAPGAGPGAAAGTRGARGRAAGPGAGTPGAEAGARPGPGAVDPAHYRTLGLPTDATAEQIEAAYRRRIKEVHPDQGGDEESFRRVREAYVALTEGAS